MRGCAVASREVCFHCYCFGGTTTEERTTHEHIRVMLLLNNHEYHYFESNLTTPNYISFNAWLVVINVLVVVLTESTLHK